MTGAEDLDRYGQWQQTPEYGALWVPRSVAVDWAPYSDRPLGLGPAVGLDLGRRRALGLRAVPLRPLGLPPQRAGAGRPAPTSPGRCMRRRWWRGSAARAPTSRSRSAAAAPGRLVPARAARGLRAELSQQPALPARRQHHARHQRHQHHDHHQQPQRRSRPARLRESQVRACGDLRSRRGDDTAPAGRAGGGALPQRSAGARPGRAGRAGAGADRAAGERAAGGAALAARARRAAAAVRGAWAGRLRRSRRWRPSRRTSGGRWPP